MQPSPASFERDPLGGGVGRPPVSDHKTVKRVLVVLGVLITGGVFGFLLTTIPPLLLFGTLFGALGALAIVINPYLGLLLYTALYVIRPGELYPVIAAMHPERVVAVLTLGAIVFSMVRRERRLYIDGSKQTALFAAFMVVAFMTLFTSYWPGHTVSGVFVLLRVFSFYLMIVHLINTRLKLKLFVFTFLLLSGYLAATSIKAYYAGELMFAQGIERAVGTTSAGGNPNTLGANLGTVLGLCLLVALAQRGFWTKMLLLVLAAGLLWTMALTGSRATMLGLLAAGLFLWVLSSKKFLIGVCALGVLAGTFVLLPDSYKERYSSVTSTEIDASSRGRIDAWKRGAEMFIDRPILGVGLGCFGVAHAKDYSSNRNWLESHSLYVQVPAETGLLGVMTFFSLILVAIRRNRSLARTLAKERPDWNFETATLNGVFVGFVFLLVFSIFGHSLMRYTWYLFVALGVALNRLHLDLPASSPEPAWNKGESERIESGWDGLRS